MGNDVSSVMAVANAKNQFNKSMGQINEQLAGQPKTDGPIPKKQLEERRKEREAEFEAKKEARAERKAKLSQQWNSHRQANSDAPEKKGLFGTGK
jgi:hypothetical protein